jgi:hypothetical protein
MVAQQSHEVLEVGAQVPAPVPARQALQVADRRGTGRRSGRGGPARRWWGRAWTELRDPGPVLRADRGRWAGVSSLTDVAALTAAWLRGEIASQPGYYGPVDVDESGAPGLTAALVAANEAGWWTRSSQAGHDGPGYRGHWRQLAWVSGLFHPDNERVWALVQAARPAGYEATLWEPAMAPRTVTWWDGRPHTTDSWMSADVVRDEVCAGLTGPALTEALDAVQLSLVDPVPGRNTLWAWLQDELGDITQPLQQDDDVSCPDCDGPSRLVDCLTCWGTAADLEPGAAVTGGESHG